MNVFFEVAQFRYLYGVNSIEVRTYFTVEKCAVIIFNNEKKKLKWEDTSFVAIQTIV